MRHIVTFNWLSADGYFADAKGELSWVVPDDEQMRRAAKDIAGFDTALFGRKTYEQFSQFWMTAVDGSDTAPDPHRPGRRTQEHRVVGAALNAMTKLVFSRTLARPRWNNSRSVQEFDPAQMAALKREPGKDIIVFGSGSIASQLAAHDLIDEYQFVVCPVLLGRGRPLLGPLPEPLTLRLAEARRYPSGDQMIRYVRDGV